MPNFAQVLYVLSLISHLKFLTITLSFQVILYFPWNFRISFRFLLLYYGQYERQENTL